VGRPRLADGGRDILGIDPACCSRHDPRAVVAYVVRFQALAFFSVDARMRRVDPALDDAARSLGADPNRVLADVHLRCCGPAS
jgi:ABC-type spermidine/putrescine transport system permease subunit II